MSVERALKLYNFSSRLRIAEVFYMVALLLFIIAWVFILLRQSHQYRLIDLSSVPIIWNGPMPILLAAVVSMFFATVVTLIATFSPLIHDTYRQVLDEFDEILASDAYKSLKDQEKTKVAECVRKAEPFLEANRPLLFLQATAGGVSTVMFLTMLVKIAAS